MYKNILVPVALDHDASTHQAIDVARELRTKEGAITFLHVMEDLPGYATQFVPSDIRKSALEETRDYLGSLEKEVPASRSLVIHGHSARSILDFADESVENLLRIIGRIRLRNRSSIRLGADPREHGAGQQPD